MWTVCTLAMLVCMIPGENNALLYTSAFMGAGATAMGPLFHLTYYA